jgi:hypothetical protein
MPEDLAYATSSLGVETYKLATGGWKLSKENVDKILPDLRELLSGLPSNTPVIFFCLDNSSFLAASEEGGLVPISKCVPEDDGYHVVGSLVVAPEKAMQYAIAQLKRAIAECGDFPVFVVTPWTRFVSQPCCMEAGHVTNFQDPDFLADLLRDLNKQKFYLRKSLAPATVLDGIQLVCGDSSSLERKEQTMRAGWANDLVHPNGHIYAKMALNLIEKIAPSTKRQSHLLQAVGNEHGAPATGMREIAARTDATAVPAAAGTVDSGTTTVGTGTQAGPAPDTGLTKPRPGAPPGNPEAKAVAAAAKVAAMEAATEAATADITVEATAATTPQANVAEETAGEVAAVDGSAATPAEADTASTSHSLRSSTQSQCSSSFVYFYQSKYSRNLCAKVKICSCCKIPVYKKKPKNVGPPLGLINN